MKNFDRSIEKMMNEHEVTPPFGMWNRIAAELETSATPMPVSVNSPIPQRTVFGFIAGALLISASMMTAYLVNEHSKEESPLIANAVITPKPTIENVTNVVSPIPTVVFRERKTAHVSKSKPISKSVEERTIATEVPATTPSQLLPMPTEVSVPTQTIAQSKGVIEPYYFPAIDVNTPSNKEKEKITASIAKTKIDSKTTGDNDREISYYDPPKIKFRPRKHRNFSYGKIIQRR